MTNFDRAMCLCGLSTRAAADFFDHPWEEITAWRLGQKEVPEAAWAMLAALRAQIEDAAFKGAEALRSQGIDPLLVDKSISITIAEDPMPVGAMEAAGALATLLYVHGRQQDITPRHQPSELAESLHRRN